MEPDIQLAAPGRGRVYFLFAAVRHLLIRDCSGELVRRPIKLYGLVVGRFMFGAIRAPEKNLRWP